MPPYPARAGAHSRRGSGAGRPNDVATVRAALRAGPHLCSPAHSTPHGPPRTRSRRHCREAPAGYVRALGQGLHAAPQLCGRRRRECCASHLMHAQPRGKPRYKSRPFQPWRALACKPAPVSLLCQHCPSMSSLESCHCPPGTTCSFRTCLSRQSLKQEYMLFSDGCLCAGREVIIACDDVLIVELNVWTAFVGRA